MIRFSSAVFSWWIVAGQVPLPIAFDEALVTWRPLVITVGAIVLYSVFVFRFYTFVAKRDVFELQLESYARGIGHLRNVFRVTLYLVEYLIVYPVLTVVWFLFFTAFLLLLTQSHGVATVLLISMAIVTAIRATAYYSEDLARDLAKLLPLSLLGVFLLEGSKAVSLSTASTLVPQVRLYWRTVLYYLLFLILLEFVLRIVRILVTRRLQTRIFEEVESGVDD